jgi:hypothetical protein
LDQIDPQLAVGITGVLVTVAVVILALVYPANRTAR